MRTIAYWLTRARSPRPRMARAAASAKHRVIIEALEGRRLFSATDLTAATPAAAALVPAADLTATLPSPSVRSVNPANGATGVLRDSFISVEVNLPDGGIDPASLTDQTVYLYRRGTGERIRAVLNTSGAGDVIVLRPAAVLDPNTRYGFVVTDGVLDVAGAGFRPFITYFTTGASASNTDPNVHFDKVPLPATAGRQYLGLAIGPDNKLYAGTTTGEILRFPINRDGTLGVAEVLESLVAYDGGAPSFVTGLAFDPSSTADHLVLWVTRSAAAWEDAPDWTGKVTELTGPNLEDVQDRVIHLPRAVRDHVTDQPAFGPDGAIYFCQASTSSMGDPDLAWGNRKEHLLSAAILRLDPAKLGTGTLDALTFDAGGKYNPYAKDAPLTLYATGVRNAYDLVWHSNGQLYAPTNGSATGGNTPAGPGVPAVKDVAEPETDYLFRIRKGYYYGHPNPVRHEYVLNGGNPTAGVDPYELAEYPVGTKPDPHWQPAAFDMGMHESPDGAIEYHGSAFGGALDHKLLVVRYSGGGDVVALNVAADGSISGELTGMDGMTGFVNPLDLVEHQPTGNLYVAELGGQCITLLRVPGQDTTGGVDGAGGGGDGQSPAPTPIPDSDRTRVQRRLIRGIAKFASRHDLAAPDVSTTPGAELQSVMSDLKDKARRQVLVGRIDALAARKKYPLPNTDTYSLPQLRTLRRQVRRARTARPGRLTG
jgi:glucose/arabinose dehydrogenase